MARRRRKTVSYDSGMKALEEAVESGKSNLPQEAGVGLPKMGFKPTWLELAYYGKSWQKKRGNPKFEKKRKEFEKKLKRRRRR